MEEVIDEELMALEAIFYDSFSKISDNRFRIRIDPAEQEALGADSASIPPLFLEVALLAGYPNALPEFDLSNLNNSKYPESVRKQIVDGLLQQAALQLGESMCYNLVEWLKEKLVEFYSLRRIAAPTDDAEGEHSDGTNYVDNTIAGAGKKEAKDKLTKAQKRRYFDRYGATAEKPRGWDWVPILSHVS
eukprot:TRINITY_DN24471_c0_g2_i2.p1 TRINITY_DN24471_c0_g2~~TRINITY_DN24471_c0_g2_i2.p1  ORF type:complete len:189 (+),score=50.71 TRINITY_DN24471_c0_g2_i2:154-720(+)